MLKRCLVQALGSLEDCRPGVTRTLSAIPSWFISPHLHPFNSLLVSRSCSQFVYLPTEPAKILSIVGVGIILRLLHISYEPTRLYDPNEDGLADGSLFNRNGWEFVRCEM
jgi:hypothetical protein